MAGAGAGFGLLANQEQAWAEVPIRFLNLLKELTEAGRAEWFQSALGETGFIRCLVDKEDLIVFECKGGEKGGELVPPTQRLAGVLSHYCNTTYLWLNGLDDWELLLELLRSAKFDEKRFGERIRIAHEAPVRVLEERLKTPP